MKVANGDDLLRQLADSEEIEIDTRRDGKSPVHRTTIWIVATDEGVYVRSGSKKGRWYQEALANPTVTIRAGRSKVPARVRPASGTSLIRAVNAAYRAKYTKSWPGSAEAVVRGSRLNTTLRLTAS